MRSRILAFLFLAFCMATAPARADIANDLNNFWQDLGGTSNRTGGSAFQGQSAGYATFGNLRYRGPSRNTTLFSFSPPSYAGGCGGIDLFAGSISFISADDLVQLSRAIAANAVGYAFDLALETLSPVIAETMKDLRARLQALNLNNINSCETAQGLVDSAIGKESQARNKLCQRIGAVKGLFTDYSDARQDCGTDPAATTDTRNSLTPAEQEPYPENTNLTWQFIRGTRVAASDWLKTDNELSEMAMTLTGTVILRENGQKDFYAPKVLSDEAFNALFSGGDLEFYDCDTHDKCLNITTITKTITDTDSVHGRVNTAFNALVNNIRQNTRPLDEHVEMINGTSVPVWRALNVFSAHSGPILESQRGSLVDLVANDVMLNWIESMVTEVSQRSKSSELSGFDSVDDWQSDLEKTRGFIIQYRIKNAQKFQEAMLVAERIHLIEESLARSQGAFFPTVNRGVKN